MNNDLRNYDDEFCYSQGWCMDKDNSYFCEEYPCYWGDGGCYDLSDDHCEDGLECRNSYGQSPGFEPTYNYSKHCLCPLGEFLDCDGVCGGNNNICQLNFLLEDLNPSSETYGINIGPQFFEGKVTLYYFPFSES